MKLIFSIAFLSSFGHVAGFSTLTLTQPSSALSNSDFITARSTKSATKLHMAEDEEEDDEPVSDELSKLIGKRASMMKKKAPTAPKPTDEEYIDPKTASLYEGKSGMDIFEMPDFKTARPLKTPKVEEDKGSSGKEDEGGYYVDYQAEYEDENDLHIPNRIGFTTKVWGDRDAGFRAGKKLKKKSIKAGKYNPGDLQLAFDKLMENGITFVDTSENYGLSSKDKSLTAENILCKCLDTNTEAEPIIASTISNPWKSIVQGTGARFGRSGILKAIEGSGDRLGTSALDVYQVPAKMFHIGAPGAVASALCMAMDQGLINNIGVKNFSKGKMKSFNQKLNKIGSYSITSNQFEFSLVNRKAWKSGLITECKRQGIIPVASNPLGDGLASGVYSATNPTGGKVSGKQPFKFETLEKYTTLHDMMLTVQTRVQKRLEKENLALKDRRDRYGGNDLNTDVTTTQIAINYIIAKGCVPMPSVKNVAEADEILGCLGWSLDDEEVKMLDNAADMSDKGVVV